MTVTQSLANLPRHHGTEKENRTQFSASKPTISSASKLKNLTKTAEKNKGALDKSPLKKEQQKEVSELAKIQPTSAFTLPVD